MDKDQYDEQVEWNNDLRAEIAALKAKLVALEAEQREQLEVIFAVGPITCRNGVSHEYQNVCLYCALAEAEKRGLARAEYLVRLHCDNPDHKNVHQKCVGCVTQVDAIRAAMEKK